MREQSPISANWQPRKVTASEPTHDGKYTVANWWRAYLSSRPIVHKPKLFAKFVEPGDLVFDIGANRGGMTWVFRQLQARVVAVEPLHQIAPDKVKQFHYKFAQDDNVALLPVAIAPTPYISLTMPDIGGQHWIVTTASKRWVKKSAHKHLYAKKTIVKRVAAVTLDDLIGWFGQPAFVKVDVEGFDAEAIATLTTPVKALNMEFHKDWLWNNRQAILHLNSLGDYEYNYALDNQGDLALMAWMDGEKLITHLKRTLTERAKGSWGDIYARLKDG